VVVCLVLLWFRCSMFVGVGLLCLGLLFLCLGFVLCRVLFRLCLVGFLVLGFGRLLGFRLFGSCVVCLQICFRCS